MIEPTNFGAGWPALPCGELPDDGGLLLKELAVEQVECLGRDGRFVALPRDEVGVGSVEEGKFGRWIVPRDRQVDRAFFLLRKGERIVEVDPHRCRGRPAGSGIELAGEEEDAIAQLFSGETTTVPVAEKAVSGIRFGECGRGVRT